jgi:hypothetical protein
MPLLEQGLAWTDRIILFGRNDHFFGWYLALNPKGVVPTVAHDRNPIGDSSVINEYLEDVFPERPLRLGNSLEHMRAWRQYIVKCRRLRPAIAWPISVWICRTSGIGISECNAAPPSQPLIIAARASLDRVANT